MSEIDKNNNWVDVQTKIQDNIEEGFEEIHKIFDNSNTDTVVVFYFLMFWSRVMGRYGKNGEKHNNKNVIKLITKMMKGDLPQDVHGNFDKKLNN